MSKDVTGQTREGKPAVMPVGTSAPAPLLDVVYVVRPGELNQNLRYSLRSLANLPHQRVYIFGYKPEWVTNVVAWPTDQENNPDQENVNNSLYEAANNPYLSDDFIFFNDDFFIMEPVKSVLPYHQGSLDARITAYKTGDRMHQAFSLIATREELRKLIPERELLSYELHVPMVFNKAKLKAAFELWTRPLLSLRPRTFYGNLYEIEGEKIDDAKESSWNQSRQNSEFYSSVTRSGTAGTGDWDQLRSRFAAPSVYESAD